MSNKTFSILVLLMLVSFCNSSCQSPFAFKENVNGVELSENGIPVFFYQKIPKSLTGQYICNNYLHPLYNLIGDTLTQEFPPDHLFHRGVFWGWHQLFMGEKNLGDGWMNEGISYTVMKLQKESNKGKANLNVQVMWNSKSLDKPFIEENTTITVHNKTENYRLIDFEIELKPLVHGLMIGGSDDEKGYGGFCVRMKMPDDLIFTSENGKVKPQNLQLMSGRWMDFSASFNGKKNGMTILCHPSDINFPQPWILRQKASMQNVAFPGRQKYNLEKTLLLKYRLVIHNGDAGSLDIRRLQQEYEK
jgi:hypothetical protein